MIPKIIHFCWLSDNPYPESIQKCLSSWKEKLSDYEIILWDKKRFDINSVQWVKEAFEEKKYAFAADYIRFYALYNYGGIYLDSDVEVLKNFDELLNCSCFFGYEFSGLPEAAVIGAVPELKWIGTILQYYESKCFKNTDGTLNKVVAPLVVKYFFEQTEKVKLLTDGDIHRFGNFVVYPNEFFSPKNSFKSNEINITKNTICIHHFNAGWIKESFINKLKKTAHIFLIKILGKVNYYKLMYKIRADLKRLD